MGLTILPPPPTPPSLPLVFAFSKCQRYSPNQSNKAYDKAVSRKTGVAFEPKLVIDAVRSEVVGKRTLKSREEYLKQYLEVCVYCIYG